MSWPVWWSLLGAATAGTTLAGVFYFHWSYRYAMRWMGVTVEVALALLIVCLGSSAVTYLMSHMP